MVVRLGKGQKVVAMFGEGTVRVHQEVLPKMNYGRITLDTCKQKKIGASVKSAVNGSDQIMLDFKNKESLDVLISKLQYLRGKMK